MNPIANLRDLRATPLEVLEREYWSKGIPALPGEPRPARDADLDPAVMTLEQLVATQKSEMPSIARSAWLAGARVDSLDLPAGDDGTETLAENIPSSHPAYDHLVTLVDPADMTPEQRKAYDAFCADFAYKGGSVPYAIEDPAVRARITWEQHWRKSSETEREGLRFPATGDRMQFFSLVGRRLERDEFIARKERFVAAFLARTGLDTVPSAAEFARKRKIFQMLWNTGEWTEAFETDKLVTTAMVEMFGVDEPEDVDAAASAEVIDEPYVPSLSLLIHIAEQAHPALPDDATPQQIRARRRTVVANARSHHESLLNAADEAAPDIQLRFRSTRDVDRYRRHNRDALWHREVMEAEVDSPVVSLGTAD